jgi:mycothiol synthase
VHTPEVSALPLRADIDDTTLAAWDDVIRTVGATERGEYASGPAASLDHLRERLDDPTTRRWVGLLDGQVAGAAEVRPAGEPDAGFTRIYVLPDRRGHGVGRSLLSEVIRDQRAAGVRVLATTVLAGTSGARYAFDLGATVGDELVIYALDVATVDRAALAQTVAAGHEGYDLVHWRGSAPDSLVDSYALAKRLIADAPNIYPPAVPPWDRELVRESERERANRGAELWVTAAVVSGTPRVAAFTAVEVGTSSVDAGQEDTVAVHEHRRRGLATWVKAAMALRLATELPSLRRVSVTTAVANTGMRAVNARTGFRELARRLLVRGEVAVVAERLHV